MRPSFIELRVHGVSGTSAVDLLQSRPVVADDDPDTDLTKPADTGDWTRAFRWSSLTSGDPKSATWILLLPYMLANVAGWALPPRHSLRRHQLDVAAVRIVATMLTAIFSVVTAYGFIVVAGYSTLGSKTAMDLGLATSIGVVISGAVIVLLWYLTRTRDAHLEPVLVDAAVDPDRDWSVLRKVHLSVAASATLWTLATVVRDGFEDVESAPFIPLAVGALGLGVAIAGISAIWRSRWLALGASVTAVASVAGSLLLSATIWFGSEVNTADPLSRVGVPLADMVRWFAFITVMTVIVTSSRAHRLAGPTIATLFAIAGASGAAVGAATIQATASLGNVDTPSGIGLIAEGFLLGTLILALFLVVLHQIADFSTTAGDNRFWRSLVAVIDRPFLIVTGTPLIITTVSALVFWRIRAVDPGTVFEEGSRIAYWLIVVALVVAFRRAPWKALGVTAGGIAVFAVADRLASDFRQVAILGTLVLPTQLIIARVISAYRDADERRAMAVPWDVGSYFPAAFHPFAPPPYGATAVDSLRKVLVHLVAEDRRPVVVGAHSQGTVIALRALQSVELPVALFTFGSPLGTLYRTFFPAHFSPVLSEAPERLVAWANLWRVTDPIGGPIHPGVDLPEQPDPRSRVHGGYWYRDEAIYNETMGRLLATLEVPETDIPDRYRR